MHQCGSHFANVNVELCAPLQRLKEEHAPLREQMDGFRHDADLIGGEDGIINWSERLIQLEKQVSAFVAGLEPHSDKEDNVLFPMMAKYIGRETGPIAVMEYEHEEAKRNLRLFAEAMRARSAVVDADHAQRIARYAIEAQTVLTEHFMKEEQVLFPMAQQLLSDEEKSELGQRMFGASS